MPRMPSFLGAMMLANSSFSASMGSLRRCVKGVGGKVWGVWNVRCEDGCGEGGTGV